MVWNALGRRVRAYAKNEDMDGIPPCGIDKQPFVELFAIARELRRTATRCIDCFMFTPNSSRTEARRLDQTLGGAA